MIGNCKFGSYCKFSHQYQRKIRKNTLTNNENALKIKNNLVKCNLDNELVLNENNHLKEKEDTKQSYENADKNSINEKISLIELRFLATLLYISER